MRVLVAILSVVAALVFAGASGAWSAPPTLNATVSWLAQRPAYVRCQTEQESADDGWMIGGAEAYVNDGNARKPGWQPAKYTVLKYGHCERLLSLSGTTSELALSLLVLTHEAGHIRNAAWSHDEARTECWAIRHVGYTAARLGVADVPAVVAAAVAWHKELDGTYQLPGCKVPR